VSHRLSAASPNLRLRLPVEATFPKIMSVEFGKGACVLPFEAVSVDKLFRLIGTRARPNHCSQMGIEPADNQIVRFRPSHQPHAWSAGSTPSVGLAING
jgi:hypothetical protein